MVLAHDIKAGDRTQDVQISQSVTFDSMLLAPKTLQGLKTSGFYKPSPIQLHGIPLGKCGFDLILEAKSGTGKTAVFSIIALEKIDVKLGLQTVILAPTREIAAQICDVIKQLGSSYEGLIVEVVMGGIPVEEDVNKFRNKRVHIVVGSPGRLRHLIQDKHIDASTIRLFVLDEADKLMEKSFISDINYIFSSSPKQKQVIMSSATYPETTKSFIQKYLQSGQHICPDSNSILLGIQQKITVIKYNSNIVKQTKNRFEELLKILSHTVFKQCLIFCNYQVRVAELHKMLTKHDWPAEQLYGQQEQLDRLDALKSLQQYKCRILISTDLAARGIDASNVDLVINFEPPFEWQTFLHRIGRAGRFGSYGVAITMLSEGKEEQKFRELLKALKFPLNVSHLWDDEQSVSDTTNKSEPSDAACSQSVTNDKEKTYKEVWNSLCSDFKPSANHIESFSNLYDSFENSVESFSDLMSSLQIHDAGSNAMNSTYNQLPMPEKTFFKAMNITNGFNKDVVATKENSRICELNNNILTPPVTSHTTKPEAPKADPIFLPNVICPIGYNQREFVSNGKNVDTMIKPYINKEDYENEEYSIPSANEALLNAGLPTAFGKCKRKIYKSHSNICEISNVKHNFKVTSNGVGSHTAYKQKNKTLNEEIENHRIGAVDSNVNNTISNNHRKQFTKVNNNEEFSEQMSKIQSNQFDSIELQHDVSAKCKNANYKDGESGHHSKKYQDGSQDQYKENSVRSHMNMILSMLESQKTIKDPSDCTNYQNKYLYPDLHIKQTTADRQYLNEDDVTNYMNWYRNLKSRVAQLQHAIYVDELSKV